MRDRNPFTCFIFSLYYTVSGSDLGRTDRKIICIFTDRYIDNEVLLYCNVLYSIASCIKLHAHFQAHVCGDTPVAMASGEP